MKGEGECGRGEDVVGEFRRRKRGEVAVVGCGMLAGDGDVERHC